MRTGVTVDSTPIYTELQKTLIDPEADHWGPSAPPEFASSLDEQAEQSKTRADSQSRKKSGRSGGRRHRAED